MIRIGQGFDVHPFAKERQLHIGGVHIPYEKGLLGHSDADVLLHAIIDALLGAAGLTDIGHLFPDTDELYQGADSVALLAKVIEKIAQESFTISNIDCTILAEKPKMQPYLPAMKLVIANTCHIQPEQINIKATTMEQMGFIGRGEGIGALAVALLEK